MPIWTSRSRTRSAVGRLMRLGSFRSRSSLLLRLQRLLRLHPKLNLRHRVRLLRKLRLDLQLDLKLHPQRRRHRELEGKTKRSASHRDAATVVSGRANPDKSATTSPSFRGAPTIRPSREMSGR